ncbi:PLAC protein [Trinorchestia longiramus]|nr:PLAC protein [Trinorchestia longiramus]
MSVADGEGLPEEGSAATGHYSNHTVVPSFETTNERPAIVPGRADTSSIASSSSGGGRVVGYDATDYRKRPMVIALGDDSAAPSVDESSQDTDESKTGCVDRMKNCHLVFRARLCRLRYYNKLCCKTCQKSSTVT